MVDFARQGQMTDACVVPRQALSNTVVVGMAHFAGSGPEGSTCGGCDYWQTPPGKKIMICDKYRQMTGDKAKAVPASTHACRHYVARPK